MKVIDLLNKIANVENVPKIIKINNKIYTKYNSHTYKDNEGNELEDKTYIIDSLNEEVEIIEEDKKIEKLDLQYKDITKGIKFEEQILSYCDNLQYKINEIIDKLNEEEEK